MREGFGQYIRELRLRKGYSQRELARLSGLNHSEISRIEGGSRPTPSPESLAKLAPYLGVPHEDLMAKLGYLMYNPTRALDEVIRRTLDEHESVKNLILQLHEMPLSNAGKEFLAQAIKSTGEHLLYLEGQHANAC